MTFVNYAPLVSIQNFSTSGISFVNNMWEISPGTIVNERLCCDKFILGKPGLLAINDR